MKTECFENRELSWLRFDQRVLEEAQDSRNPLLERLCFTAIFQSNMDEFFRVRVGNLTVKKKQNPKKKDSISKMTPEEQLRAIFDEVRELTPMRDAVYHEIMSQLRRYGLEQVDIQQQLRNRKCLQNGSNAKFVRLPFR